MLSLSLTLTRILVYLSATGASVGIWQRGRLREVNALAVDEEGWQQFDALLATHPKTPVSIVVDTVDEQFRDEVLPRAFGMDRREMAQRRLRQMLVQSPYRAVLRQGPVGPGRQGDHYLFMGLTGHELLRPWLDVIHLHKAPLAGIWLAPALSGKLLRRLRLGSGRLLLVSEQTGGLRLSYFEAGRLRFSRLAPVDNALYDNPLEGYGEEIERTRQYLLSQRLLVREEKLPVFLIDPLDSLGELHALLPESAGFRCETIARPRLVADLGLPPSLLAESTDALYLNLLPHAEREANLQPTEMRAAYTRFLLQRWLYTGGGLWLAVCVLLSAALLVDTWRQSRAAGDYAQFTHKTRLEELRMVGSAEEVRHLQQRLALLGAWRHVDSHGRDPSGDFQTVLAAAQAQEGLQIQQLDWRRADESGTRELRVSGEVTPFLGDYRAAHARIQSLLDHLARSGWLAGVEQWPMDASPGGTATGELSSGVERARATFLIFLRRMPAS